MTTAYLRLVQVLVAAGLMLAVASQSRAETQRLTLDSGWNLVSFAVQPVDPSPAAALAPIAEKVVALWGYDAASGLWSRYPQVTAGAPQIVAIEPGRGYWLQLTDGATLDVQVPLPAGVWLFASALAALGLGRRRRA